jgi:hypothetical protein
MNIARLALIAVSLFMVLGHNVQAQHVAIPAWMRPYFAEGATATLPAVVRGPVRQNTFIGSYTMKLTIWDEGIAQTLYLTSWQDSTRGMMLLQLMPGIPHTTYFADLEANTAVIANALERKAVVGDLARVVLVDHLREPGKTVQFPELPTQATGNTRELAGITCQEHILVERSDTMHLWTAPLDPFPYADAPAWLPMNVGPLKLFRFLFKLGATPVMKFTLPGMLDLEMTQLTQGPTPPPVMDLSLYTITEEPTLQQPMGKP